MESSITVFWPDKPVPEIDEIRFSHQFCRRLSRRLCRKADTRSSWLEYTDDFILKQVRSHVKGGLVLVVKDPEIIISTPAVNALTKCIKKGYPACGPVYNHTPFPQQLADLPAIYVDISTFLEVSEMVDREQDGTTVSTKSLDPACVLYRTDFLQEFDPDRLLMEIPGSLSEHRNAIPAIARGALVHASFEKGFEAERNDLVALVPDGIKRVLDIGCAKGGYGKTLKLLRPEIFLTGIELNPKMAKAAERHYDEVITRPVEEARFSRAFDLINCGDIIEHLRDPWEMLKRFHGLLTRRGYLIMSIPNAGHWTVAADLLKGKFQYTPLGIQCVAHLRWFTESSIREGLEAAGFVIDRFEREQIPPTPKGELFIRNMCAPGYGDETSLKTNEFIIRAVKKFQARGIPLQREDKFK